MCRFCGAPLDHLMVDLGMSPLCESFLSADRLGDMEPFYPLQVRVCGTCFLAQLPELVAPSSIFTEYAYFSSYSSSWLEHARSFAVRAHRGLGLGRTSLVVEVGSNDGYLLRHFVDLGVPVLGIDPAANVTAAASKRGVPTRTAFFGRDLAGQLVEEGLRADLVVGNNVLAQVPDVNDFVAGLREIVAADGLISLEFPHLLRLLEGNQFDTIYHEHFSYFSLATTIRILAANGLAVVDVEELPTHGGSLRVWARRAEASPAIDDAVGRLLEVERAAGLGDPAVYVGFGERVEALKRDLLSFLINARREGKRVAGYGAPGKANTLLNYCGIRTDLLEYTVDMNPYKQGRFTPGTHIPIHEPDRIALTRPDFVWILPWNLTAEITQQLSFVRDWGGRFLVAVPSVRVIP